MATGSLVLKISADLNDFQRQLNSMTKSVRQAADQVTEMGKQLSIGITLPVTLAGAALMKMAAENEEAAARMQRSFGPAVTEVQERLDRLAKTMPVAGTELQNMATRINDVAQELGFAKPAAAQLSTSLLTMANDLSAFAAVPAEEAAQALTAAMQGQTRGLKALGITLGEAEIKQQAYRLGILKTGETLTPAGQALATYAALLQRSGQFAGEAAKRQNDIGRQLGLIKRDLAEVADRLATRLIPFFRTLTGMLRTVVGWIERVPMGFWVTVSAAAALAAAIGPAAIAVAQLTKAFVLMQAAIQIISGAAGITGLLGKLRALATNPAVLALIAIAVAAGAAYVAYRKFRGEVEQSGETSEEAADGLAQLQDLLNGIGSTSAQSGDAVQQLAQQFQQMQAAVERTEQLGQDVADPWDRLLSVGTQITRMYEQQTDKLSEQALLLQGMVLQFTTIRRLRNLADLMNTRGATQEQVQARIDLAAEPRAISEARVASEALQRENSLRTREVALEMIQIFPVVRLAAVDLKESFLKTAQDFALARETLKQSWQRGNIGQGIGAGMKQALTPFVLSLTPASLAAAALGRVLDGMRLVLEPISNMLEVFGRVIGVMITPILKAFFPVLKIVGEVLAFLGEIVARVAAGIATGVGRLLVGIGKLLNLLPGSIGNPLIKVGKALLGYADDQYAAASALKQARKDIKAMRWEDTAGAVDDLGAAARETAEALLNVPTGFRIALERFRAQAPYMPGYPLPMTPPSGAPLIPPGTTPGGAPNGDPGGPPMQVVVPLVVDGKVLARAVLQNLQRAAQQQAGNSTEWALVQAL
ncbi:MAG: hypothetical protein C0503_02885 [Gemmatimonas sp.]|nr:hypothetical protein [Gemmatimonas sp.]